MASIPWGKTVLAMCAGVSTVCAGAVVIEKMETSTPPEFGLSFSGVSRYDLNTFAGRYKQMFLMCDPLLLLRSDQSFRDCAVELTKVKESHERDPTLAHTPEENERLWKLKRVVDSAMPNPESGVVIPPPFRMSGYVPFNGPICVGQVGSSSTAGLLFWAWINQSQNVLVDYFNRNASSKTLDIDLAQSHSIAVTAALSVVYLLAVVIKKKCAPVQAAQLLRFAAFPSTILASCMNCYMIRSAEIEPGVPLLHPETLEELFPPSEGNSSLAARKGVLETTASRAILQVPVYFIPPFLLSTVFASTLTANPALSIPLTTYLLLVSFGYGLPFALAWFPQYGEIEMQHVEEKFKSKKLTDSRGNIINSFKYNKGL